MSDIKEPILNYWYRALASEKGIEILTTDTRAASQRLYKARHDAKDSDLNLISICASPHDPDKLWLVKRKPKDG